MFPLHDTLPSRHLPVAMLGLMAVNAVAFVYELTLPPHVLEKFFQQWGMVPLRYTHPKAAVWLGPDDLLPFVTSLFLHGGFLHIVANLWTLWIFGDNVEDRMGAGRFLAFYLLCGLVGGVAHFLSSPHSPLPAIGASGAIAGVLGAYALLFPNGRVITLVPIFFYPLLLDVPAFLYLLVWFWVQLYSGTLALAAPFAGGGVAYWAHIGGFLTGMATHRLFLRGRRR